MSFLLGQTRVDDIACIHLNRRKDRITQAKRQARKKHFSMRISKATPNTEYPNLGKFSSHLNCIQEAKKRKAQSVLILEDDFKVLTAKMAIPYPPVKWDMLYLGGNIQSVIQDNDTDASQTWKRVTCLMTHAYVVHYNAFNRILTEGRAALKAATTHEQKSALHLDQWYCTNIHPALNVYITTPERVIQRDGYSDVQRKDVTYSQQKTGGAINGDLIPPKALDKPQMSEFTYSSEEKYLRIALPDEVKDVPAVALITCLHNQVDFFQFQQWCYYRLDYPRDKLCWLIVDDSSNELKVSPLIDGKDSSIKYVRCEMAENAFLSISKKINLAMKYLGPDVKYILHVAPDVIYPVTHVRDRVKLLMAYPKYQCIGCTRYGVYEMDSTQSGQSFEQSQPDTYGNPTMVFGPSLAYTQDWWKERNFDENEYTLETFYFIRGRWDRVLDVPYTLVCIALTGKGVPITEIGRYSIGGKAITSSVSGTAVARTAQTRKTHLDDGELGEKSEAAQKVASATTFESGWDLATKKMVLMLGGLYGSSL